MFEACGVFSLNMFYVFIDVDCFVVNLMNVWFAFLDVFLDNGFVSEP